MVGASNGTVNDCIAVLDPLIPVVYGVPDVPVVDWILSGWDAPVVLLKSYVNPR